MQKIIALPIIAGLWLLSTSAVNDREETITPDIESSVVIQANEILVPRNLTLRRVISDSPIETPKTVLLEVPFTSQAPHANWKMPYREACEEASLVMVQAYLDKEKLDATIADKKLLKIVEWETLHGYAVDTDIKEGAEVARAIYGLKSEIYYDDDVNLENIKKILAAGHPIIIPAAGQMLGNPNFTGAGPAYHMLVIVGYDEKNFITHDPGTRNGKNYSYTFDKLINAIHDWNGSKNSIKKGRKAMLVLTK